MNRPRRKAQTVWDGWSETAPPKRRVVKLVQSALAWWFQRVIPLTWRLRMMSSWHFGWNNQRRCWLTWGVDKQWVSFTMFYLSPSDYRKRECDSFIPENGCWTDKKLDVNNKKIFLNFGRESQWLVSLLSESCGGKKPWNGYCKGKTMINHQVEDILSQTHVSSKCCGRQRESCGQRSRQGAICFENWGTEGFHKIDLNDKI